jgi:hypothetical protein
MHFIAKVINYYTMIESKSLTAKFLLKCMISETGSNMSLQCMILGQQELYISDHTSYLFFHIQIVTGYYRKSKLASSYLFSVS